MNGREGRTDKETDGQTHGQTDWRTDVVDGRSGGMNGRRTHGLTHGGTAGCLSVYRQEYWMLDVRTGWSTAGECAALHTIVRADGRINIQAHERASGSAVVPVADEGTADGRSEVRHGDGTDIGQSGNPCRISCLLPSCPNLVSVFSYIPCNCWQSPSLSLYSATAHHPPFAQPW